MKNNIQMHIQSEIGNEQLAISKKRNMQLASSRLPFANCKLQIAYYLLPIVYCLLIITSCGDKSKEENKGEAAVNENLVQLTDAQLKNATVETGKLEQKSISSILKLTGSVDVPPENIVSVSFPLGGYLKSSKLLPGTQVRKGEAIAVMEDPQFIQLQQDYLTAKSKLAFSEQEFNRQKELNQSKASSDKLFQQTQVDYMSQKILVNALFQKLQLININPANLNESNISRSANIYSPIDGFISEVNVNIGKYVNPSDVLFEIVNPEDIHLALNVFEKDINRLAPGQKVMAYTNINPDKKYHCEIMLVGKELSKDRSVEVHCHFKERDKSLVPGMFMNAEIEVQSNNAYVLPAEAVVSYESKQYVFIVKGKNDFEMVEVKTGNTNDGYVEIIPSDTAAFQNMTFVTKGAYSLLMKMKNTSDE